MSWAFRHGWGFDRHFWDPLRAALGIEDPAADRGYFGPAQPIASGRDTILVGHSLGALLAIGEAAGARALIAINGFDRFTATPGFPGVAPRVLDAMIRRIEAAPAEVARHFRARCGADTAPAGSPTPRLEADLLVLRDADARAGADACDVPLLLLDGGADPIVAPAHRNAVFANRHRETLEGGGHLLPLTHPAWCAGQIARFVAGLA